MCLLVMLQKLNKFFVLKIPTGLAKLQPHIHVANDSSATHLGHSFIVLLNVLSFISSVNSKCLHMSDGKLLR
jgi:hypothetical protein